MSSTDEYVGLFEASKLARVTKQTVRNWASAGLIETGRDPKILGRMNSAKVGRPHEQYYSRAQIEDMAAQRITPNDATYIRFEDAMRALCISQRTLSRLREREKLTEHLGTDGNVYLKKEQVAALLPHVHYRTTLKPEVLDAAAARFGLTEYRHDTV